ncbi:DUF4132 domain-containing protein [Methylophilus glucosoxydans]|uniref:DUF4132 domain-containing protein n=1 Tax=Methylophilus glucosoxydans TaxID=752553 RepID=A0ABW3GGC5_9PROT
MSLIRKVLGVFSPGLSNNDSYTGWLKQLSDYLRYEGRHKNLGASTVNDILSFVGNGDTPSVLDYVAKNNKVSAVFQLENMYANDKKESARLAALYKNFDSVETSVALRWVKLLEASISRSSGLRYAYVFPKNEHWPEILLIHSTGFSLNSYSSEVQRADKLSYNKIEELLIVDGLPPNSLLVSAFSSPVSGNWFAESRLPMVTTLQGYAEGLQRHAESLKLCLMNNNVPQRLHMIKLLENANNSTLKILAPELIVFAVANSKQVRAAASALIRKSPIDDFFESLKHEASKGKPEARIHALRLLHSLAISSNNAAVVNFVKETAKADKAPNVNALLNEWDNELAPINTQVNYQYDVPSVKWNLELTSEIKLAIDNLWSDINCAIDKLNKQSRDWHDQMLEKGHKHTLHLVKNLPTDLKKPFFEYLSADSPKTKKQINEYIEDYRAGNSISKSLNTFAASPAVTAVVLLKTLVFFDFHQHRHDGSVSPQLAIAFNAFYSAKKTISLLMLQKMLEPLEITASSILEKYCSSWSSIGESWNDEDIWPFFAHNLELVNQILNPSSARSYWFDRHKLYKGIGTLPFPPESIVNTLFDIALGNAKTDRTAAQNALSNLPGKEKRIINALSDGKGDVRTIAAQWLTRLNYEPAKISLEEAVLKEKSDIAKGAMLDALIALGESVEKYLNLDALKLEADKSLAKGLPKDLEWFPWNAIPVVKWEQSNEAISSNVLRWLLIQAFKQKSPEPNAILRKYCAMFDIRDREQFGQFVLEAWLTEDIKPISPDLALQQAQNQAQYAFNSMKNHPQYWEKNPHFGKSVEELTSAYLPGFLRQPVGSAISSKGILAISAACASERAAEPVRRYLKEYYGTRAAQGKALIGMLSWIEHPTATQLMLSIGNRFRTKSFQEEAARQATALAERKGWTLSELADRTIPSAGFDESGELQLSYGQRIFTAKLLDDLSVRLFNPEGKEIKALPEPRQDDDATQAKDSKKAFSAVKKEIKAVIDMQTDRLYEALCVGKQWKVNDWQLYLNQHPIMRRLIQKLIWVEHDGQNIVQSFRPLDDGTLTDINDNEVNLNPTSNILVAHDSLLSAEQVAQWQAHLKDYEVNSLFQQLGKGIYVLPEDKSKSDQIDDFEGHLIEAYSLRNRALKLGYTRGAAEDGGWFMTYEKRFIDLGVTSVIEFTGNPLPEENRTVALLSMYFANSQSKGWERDRLALHKIPKVLLSESYNDMRLISAEGSGYDKDWQKKSEY